MDERAKCQYCYGTGISRISGCECNFCNGTGTTPPAEVKQGAEGVDAIILKVAEAFNGCSYELIPTDHRALVLAGISIQSLITAREQKAREGFINDCSLKIKISDHKRLLEKAVRDERERVCDEILKQIAPHNVYKCPHEGHDDRWCPTCEVRTDTLNMVEEFIAAIRKGE